MSDEGFLVGREEARRLARELRRAEARPIERIDPGVFPPYEGVEFIGKLTEDLQEGETAQMDIWAGSPAANTGVSVEPEDWFLKPGQAIESGTKVYCKYVGGVLRVLGASCAERSTSTSTGGT